MTLKLALPNPAPRTTHHTRQVDAAYLVTASSDCAARLWDLATGDAIRVYSGHHNAVVCCALNDSAIVGGAAPGADEAAEGGG